MSLRQAAQQALEALEIEQAALEYEYGKVEHIENAITALRAALAEPEQEPIGHADLGINNIYIFSALEPRVIPVGRTPLYTAPTPRKPLTDEEIRGLADKHLFYQPEGYEVSGIFNFARAIERAHGIGEQHE